MVRPRLLEHVRGLEPRLWAAIVATCVVFLAILGTIRYETGASALSPFDFDGEQNVAAAFSSLLLIAAAAAAFASSVAPWCRLGAALVGLAMFFVYMAVDEFAEVHERLGGWTGLGETARELPIALIGTALWVATFLQLRYSARAAIAFVAGATAWFAAQVLEKVELSGKLDAIYGLLALTEEALEPTGSALFVLAFVFAARDVRS